MYAEIIGEADISVLRDRTYDLLAAADAGAITSGTATLETAMFSVPQVVCYASNPISVRIAKIVANVKYISLVNLIMDRPILLELIQNDLKAKPLAAELDRLLNDEARSAQMKSDYLELHEKLGKPGGSKRVAQRILELM